MEDRYKTIVRIFIFRINQQTALKIKGYCLVMNFPFSRLIFPVFYKTEENLQNISCSLILLAQYKNAYLKYYNHSNLNKNFIENEWYLQSLLEIFKNEDISSYTNSCDFNEFNYKWTYFKSNRSVNDNYQQTVYYYEIGLIYNSFRFFFLDNFITNHLCNWHCNKYFIYFRFS